MLCLPHRILSDSTFLRTIFEHTHLGLAGNSIQLVASTRIPLNYKYAGKTTLVSHYIHGGSHFRDSGGIFRPLGRVLATGFTMWTRQLAICATHVTRCAAHQIAPEPAHTCTLAEAGR